MGKDIIQSGKIPKRSEEEKGNVSSINSYIDTIGDNLGFTGWG